MNVSTKCYVNTSSSSGDISDKTTNANLLVGLVGHIYLFIYLFTYLLTYLLTYLFIYVFIYLFIIIA